MADLSSSGAENLYQTILTLISGNISASFKSIEDGQGNTTGLQLRTDAIKALKLFVENVTSTSADEGNFLTFDNTTKEVKRVGSSIVAPFDSGWRNLTGYNGSSQTYGLPTISNLPATPQYRVVGREVKFRGTFCVPLAASGGGLVGDYDEAYGSETTGIQTADSGWEVNNTGRQSNAESPRLTASSTLDPDSNIRFENVWAYRQVFSTAASGDPINLSALVDVEFDSTNGSVKVIALKQLEFGGDSFAANQSKNSLRRFLTTRMNANDYDLSFDSYRTSTDGSSTVNAQFTASDGTLQLPMNVYADEIDYLGGFLIRLDGMSYTISSNTSIAAIAALF